MTSRITVVATLEVACLKSNINARARADWRKEKKNKRTGRETAATATSAATVKGKPRTTLQNAPK